MCLQWATASSAEEKHEAGKKTDDRVGVVADEWFEALPFQSIESTAHAGRDKMRYIRFRGNYVEAVTGFKLVDFTGSMQR